MAQLSNLILCRVRVVDTLCKVHIYERAYLSTSDAILDAMTCWGNQLQTASAVAIERVSMPFNANQFEQVS